MQCLKAMLTNNREIFKYVPVVRPVVAVDTFIVHMPITLHTLVIFYLLAQKRDNKNTQST